VNLRSRARTSIKRVTQAIEQQDKAAAQQAYVQAVKVMDQVADKGVLHRNTVARYKSRLNARIRVLD
jgi:small subunit ribosomal protein S20